MDGSPSGTPLAASGLRDTDPPLPAYEEMMLAPLQDIARDIVASSSHSPDPVELEGEAKSPAAECADAAAEGVTQRASRATAQEDASTSQVECAVAPSESKSTPRASTVSFSSAEPAVESARGSARSNASKLPDAKMVTLGTNPAFAPPVSVGTSTVDGDSAVHFNETSDGVYGREKAPAGAGALAMQAPSSHAFVVVDEVLPGEHSQQPVKADLDVDDAATPGFLSHLWANGVRSDAFRVGLQCTIGFVLSALFCVVTVLREPFSTNATWVVITALMVIEGNIGNTVRKSLQRILGTALGAVVGFVILVMALETGSDRCLDCETYKPYLMVSSLAIFCFVMQYCRWVYPKMQYFYSLALVTGPMVALGTYVSGSNDVLKFGIFRTLTIVIGAAIGLACSLFIFPVRARSRFVGGMAGCWTDLAVLIDDLVGLAAFGAAKTVASDGAAAKAELREHVRAHQRPSEMSIHVAADDQQRKAFSERRAEVYKRLRKMGKRLDLEKTLLPSAQGELGLRYPFRFPGEVFGALLKYSRRMFYISMTMYYPLQSMESSSPFATEHMPLLNAVRRPVVSFLQRAAGVVRGKANLDELTGLCTEIDDAILAAIRAHQLLRHTESAYSTEDVEYFSMLVLSLRQLGSALKQIHALLHELNRFKTEGKLTLHDMQLLIGS
eukprot:Opistho-1_new@40429